MERKIGQTIDSKSNKRLMAYSRTERIGAPLGSRGMELTNQIRVLVLVVVSRKESIGRGDIRLLGTGTGVFIIML